MTITIIYSSNFKLQTTTMFVRWAPELVKHWSSLKTTVTITEIILHLLTLCHACCSFDRNSRDANIKLKIYCNITEVITWYSNNTATIEIYFITRLTWGISCRDFWDARVRLKLFATSQAVSFFSVYSFSGRKEKSGLRPTGNSHMCQNELHCLRVAVLFSRKTHIIHDTRR